MVLAHYSISSSYSVIVLGESSSERNCCWLLTFRQPMQKSSSESSEKLWSVDKSGPLKLIGQFSGDAIGCKTRVKFVNST